MSELDHLGPLMDLVAGPLGTLVLERLPTGHFRQFGRAPGWVTRLSEGNLDEPESAFPFLQTFLTEAEEIWRRQSDGILRSGFWAQPVVDEPPLHLTAHAVRIGELRLLTIASDEDSYRDHQLLAQRGRESALALEQLKHEVQKKEILVHCIVHDLALPISTVARTFKLLEEESDQLPAELVAAVESAARASHRQDSLVGEILDAFAAEQEQITHVDRTRATAPDALDAVRAAVSLLEGRAAARGVRVLVQPAQAEDFKVVGEASRLERVMVNLIENALQFTPRGTTVRVALRVEADAVVVSVDDEGPGVPKSLRRRLFDKFVQGSDHTGRMGLGLYFCAMIVRGWGGEISCVTAPSGGARFEIRLPRPDDARPAASDERQVAQHP